MATEYEVEVVGHRSVRVRHPDGHQWHFRFPDGWTEGPIDRYAPTDWAGERPADDPFVAKSAETLAIGIATREGWIGQQSTE